MRTFTQEEYSENGHTQIKVRDNSILSQLGWTFVTHLTSYLEVKAYYACGKALGQRNKLSPTPGLR